MRRRAVICALAALLLPAFAAGATTPSLKSVSSHRRHVVAVFALGDLAPGKIVVATKRATGRGGALLAANVKLREALAPTRRNGLYRWQTKHTLRAGKYYVQVSGVPIIVDCLPNKGCPVSWSNIRRVFIPRS